MYYVRDRIHNNYRHRIDPYHRRRCERLDGENVGIHRPALLKGHLRGGWSRQAVSGSRECSPSDPPSGFHLWHLRSEERQGCWSHCNSHSEVENESLLVASQVQKPLGRIRHTVVINGLVGTNLHTSVAQISL